ncbi:MAG: hypothetical protein II781_02845 [Clostridia bacterium]|nr:hypothetical protein [Clostridia bacterium]
MEQRRDQFKEETVTKHTGRVLNSILLGITYLFLFLFAAMALLGLSQLVNLRFYIGNFILLILGGLGTFLTNRQVRRLRTEYDYTFTNGDMEIARVMSGKVRKNVIQFRMSEILDGCYDGTEKAQKLRSEKGYKVLNCTLNSDTEKLILHLNRVGRPTLVVMEPSDTMASLMADYNRSIDMTRPKA